MALIDSRRRRHDLRPKSPDLLDRELARLHRHHEAAQEQGQRARVQEAADDHHQHRPDELVVRRGRAPTPISVSTAPTSEQHDREAAAGAAPNSAA